MGQVTLSATPKGNGFQATVTYPERGVDQFFRGFPDTGGGNRTTALKVLGMPERLTDLDRPDTPD
ncbi:hypothetical protein [Novosphingobium sp.]|uniref:hypothetical protein n=1 Tax=Novosphingobium sp. TaxID=1874826 RepID=UPI0035B177E2